MTHPSESDLRRGGDQHQDRRVPVTTVFAVIHCGRAVAIIAVVESVNDSAWNMRLLGRPILMGVPRRGDIDRTVDARQEQRSKQNKDKRTFHVAIC